jgi:hypothetical protein
MSDDLARFRFGDQLQALRGVNAAEVSAATSAATLATEAIKVILLRIM